MRSRSKSMLVGGLVLIGQGCQPPAPLNPAPSPPPRPRPQTRPTDPTVIGAADTTFIGAVRQASLIFEGLVLTRGSSAVPSSPSYLTALVLVGQVFRSP